MDLITLNNAQRLLIHGGVILQRALGLRLDALQSFRRFRQESLDAASAFCRVAGNAGNHKV